jgi:hypothetical protein
MVTEEHSELANANGFSEIVISVEDISRLRDALTKEAGWTAVELPDAPPEQHTAWHVPTECKRIEQCLLTAEKMIRVV